MQSSLPNSCMSCLDFICECSSSLSPSTLTISHIGMNGLFLSILSGTSSLAKRSSVGHWSVSRRPMLHPANDSRYFIRYSILPTATSYSSP